MNSQDRKAFSSSQFFRWFVLLEVFFFFGWILPAKTPAFAGTSPSGSSAANSLPLTSGNMGNLSNPVPRLFDFVHDIQNGQENALAGVYVPGVMAFRIVQQPAEDAGFVSQKPGVLTQFGLVNQYHTIGLLAHNYLAGSAFFDLEPGEKVFLIYGDGSIQYYRIDHIDNFQALSPNSPYSSFREIGKSDGTLSVGTVFNRIYASGDRLVFQTCIQANGEPSWGRIFITAFPLQPESGLIALRVNVYHFS